MMSDNVVTFSRRDGRDLIWVCACGSTTHYHRASGDVECASCGNIASGSTPGWRERLPEAPVDAPPLDSDTFKVVAHTSFEVWARRQIKEDAKSPIVACIVIHQEGSASTWGHDGFERALEVHDWLRERITEAVARMTRV